MTYGADPFPLGPFTKGVNNRLPSYGLGADRLRNAVNIDIDNSGHLHRRAGAVRAVIGTAVRNVWFDGDAGPGYYADGPALLTFTPYGNPPWSAVPIAIVTMGARVAFCSHGGDVYWSDGILTGHIVNGVSFPWGIVPPGTDPVLRVIPGGLYDGQYQVCYTYVRSDGEESGADLGSTIVISHTDRSFDGTAGIEVSGIVASPDPTVATINLYCTAANGTVMFRVATLPNADGGTQITYVDNVGQVLNSQFLTQPPAGAILCSFGARIFIASGNVLYYSEQFAPGWFNPASGFIPFPEPITEVLGVADGLFVGTNKGQYFLQGGDPEQMKLEPKLPYGVLPYTGVVLPHKEQVAWMTARGIVVGSAGGALKNMQEDEVAVENATGGILGYREADGMRQLVAVLSNAVPSGMVNADFTEQEARRIATVLPLG